MPYLKRWPHTYQSSTLTNWRAARANAASQPVDVVYYGNSLTQDGGTGDQAILGGYTTHVGNWMNAKLGKQHGPGFECARINGGALRWTYTNNSGQQATYNPVGAFQAGTVGHVTGFGVWTAALVPTDVMTYTGVMDRFDILYVKTKTGGGTVEVRIDGVLQGSFNTLDAAQPGSTLGTFDASNAWTSPALTNASHTVTLTNVGGDISYIEGIYAYNTNYDSGFRFWNGAHSGYWGTYNVNTAINSLDIIKKRQPALTVWAHFYNDRHLPFGGTAQYTSWANKFIDTVRTYSPNTDILICTEWENPSWGPTNQSPHAEMRAATLSVAAAKNVGVIDLSEFIGSVGYNGVYTDPMKWVRVGEGTHQTPPDGFLQFAKIHHAYLNDMKPPSRPQGL